MSPTPSENPLPFAEEEYEQRLASVRRKMAESGLRALLVHTPENIYYLTGYQTPGYYMYQTLIVPEDKPPLILTRLIEEVNVRAASWIQNRATYKDTQDPVTATYQALVDAGLTAGRIGVEKSCWFFTIAQYERLCSLLGPGNEVIDVSGLVESLRVVKSPAEIDYIRKAAVAANDGMAAGFKMIREGNTETDVNLACHNGIIAAGGEYMGLPVFIGSGPRVYLTHATSVGRRLEKGDLLFIELSGCIMRYSAALFRTAYLGAEPSAQIRAMGNGSVAALNAVIESIRPGVTCDDVDRVSRETWQKHGFDLPKRTGYSIGINFPPDWGEGHALSLREGEGRVLEPGMVFHVPSSVRVYGEAFVGTSETILVTPTGREVLTSTSPDSVARALILVE